jgi:beta-phosphoglucomutase-like phosphatase (HAD superfamily)
MSFAGAILDVDGVLVDSPHERAWRDTLRELMDGDWRDIRGRTSYAPERFTHEVYQHEVAGKPRMSGARAALEHFGVPDVEEMAGTYADRKQQRIVELIAAGEFTAFPDALRLVLRLRAAGIPIATASSSKNAALFLRAIRLDTFAAGQSLDHVSPGTSLLDFVDADLSGRDFARGKPDPEIFLAAAEALGVAPRACFVVEDAVAGIAAAVAGGMAALGVARGGEEAQLAAAGADLVVTTLDQVDVSRLRQGRLAAAPPPAAAGLVS